MKRFFNFFAMAMCITLLILSFASCSPFMSASSTKKAVDEFGIPQATMTLNFTTRAGNKFKYVITYDLLLDKTPVAVISFINLVESGFYTDAIFDSYDASGHYFKAANYAYRKNADSDKPHGYVNVSGITIPGEFKTNNFREPKDGYEQFSLLSLAMYHDNKAESFDSANGALIVSTFTSSEDNKPLNYTNYAVFARMVSVAIYEGDSETAREYTRDNFNPNYLYNLTGQTLTTSCSMTNASGDSESKTVLGSNGTPRFVFSIEVVDSGKDWSKLPKVN